MSAEPGAGGLASIAARRDRDLSKQVLRCGAGRERPAEGARCGLALGPPEYCDESGPAPPAPPPASRYLRPAGFTGRMLVGSADSCLDMDLERCVRSMTLGERALLVMSYRDAEGRLARRVSCEAELLELEPDEPIGDWEWNKLLEWAERLKERGVELVKEKRIADAFRQFSKAHKFLVTCEPYDTDKIPSESLIKIKELKMKLLNNLAHCQLHFHEYDAALYICNEVLSVEENNVKALYRRCIARMGLRLWEAAFEDVQAVLRLEPANTDARHKADLLKPKIQKINEDYSKMIKKMFV